MGKYGWDSKIGDLLADERCVAVFKEILPAALESPLLKLVKGKPAGVVLDSQKKIPQEKRDALKAALEAETPVIFPEERIVAMAGEMAAAPDSSF